MNKQEIDKLYHDLRELCVSDDIQQKEAILGITLHLTTHGDYTELLRFLAYYGENYLLPRAVKFLEYNRIKFTRVVEFGAGLGWLGRGISQAANNLPLVLVDKRQWTLIDIVADLESPEGRKRVLEQMQDGDLIVMSEFLHCLDSPRKVLAPFAKWPMLIIEYNSLSAAYMKSYNEQIAKFDCVPVESFRKIFPSSKVISIRYENHVILLALPL